MKKIGIQKSLALYSLAATRQIEKRVQQGKPQPTLMQRAGFATARLCLALQPQAKHIWIACGPGNNGGDGLVAALELQQRLAKRGTKLTLTWLGSLKTSSEEIRHLVKQALDLGIYRPASPTLSHLETVDFAIDAVLGIGIQANKKTLPEQLKITLAQLYQFSTYKVPILAVDIPSGLHSDTGTPILKRTIPANYTLSLLTLKPGLFTHQGRTFAGEIWFDALGSTDQSLVDIKPMAYINTPQKKAHRLHHHHKGSFGKLLLVGGDTGMVGAILLAAKTALQTGAGYVYTYPLSQKAPGFFATCPEVMVLDKAQWQSLPLENMVVVCGCGGGQAISDVLLEVLLRVPKLVLDADALNTIAQTPEQQKMLAKRQSRGQDTVITPHPLEATRLLGGAWKISDVQENRLGSATLLQKRFACTVVLKGSGTIITTPTQSPVINPTGNGKLATPGTGDVLAGFIGSLIAQGMDIFSASKTAVWRHGLVADQWQSHVLPAGQLAEMV